MRHEHLLGRTFIHGSQDCYGVLRDFFKDNFDLPLVDFGRPDDWWEHGLNLYMENFRSQGFESIDIAPHQAQPADVLLVSFKSVVANHAGVMLEDGRILHHMMGRLSEAVPLRGIWRNNVCAIVRNKTLIVPVEVTTVDLIERILPHKRRRIENAMSATP